MLSTSARELAQSARVVMRAGRNSPRRQRSARMKSSADVLPYSAKIQKYKQNIEEFLNVLLLVVRDELVSIVENKKFSQYSKSALMQSTKIIEEGIRKYKSNCSINSVVEGVLMGMLEVKFKCQR